MAAPPSKTAATDDDDAQLQRDMEIYKKGIALFEKGEYRAAIRVLKSSASLMQRKNTLYALGEAHRRLGERRLAYRFYEAYAAKLTPAERQAFQEKLQVLRQEAPSVLAVSSRPAGATVRLNGEVVGKTPPNGQFRTTVSAGKHVISLELDGFQTVHRSVQAEFGEALAVDADLASIERATRKRYFVAGLLLGPSFESYPDGAIPAGQPAPDLAITTFELGLWGGHVWRIGAFGVGLATEWTLVLNHDQPNYDQAAFLGLLAGLVGQYVLLESLSLDLRLMVGPTVLVGARPDHGLIRLPSNSPVSSDPLWGLALRPVLGIRWRVWRQLSLDFAPVTFTYCPKTFDFSHLHPDVGGVFRYEIGVGVSWQFAT